MLFGVLLVSLVASIFELASVASILPFMAMVMNTDGGFGQRILNFLAQHGVEGRTNGLIIVGLATVVAICAGNAASALNQWVQLKFLARVRRQLTHELFEGYLRQPYLFHVARDSSSLAKLVIQDVQLAVLGYMNSVLGFISRSFVTFALVALIILQDPFVALGVVVVMGGTYGAVYFFAKEKLNALGQQIMLAGDARHRIVYESLGGVKELIVLGRTTDAVAELDTETRAITQAEIVSSLTGMMPRYALETIAFGGIVAITLLLLMRGDAQSAIPTLALYAFAGYRILPAIQQLYASAVNIKFFTPSVANLERDLELVKTSVPQAGSAPMISSFDKAISFRNVVFGYPAANRPAIDGVSTEIRRNESIGLVGKTGSGKTTFVDLLLGLYSPNSGKITVDGTTLTSANAKSWRRHIGYVPQHIFLKNASILENIALGVSKTKIDRSAAEQAARMAQADEFIVLLPNGYDTVVGERGVKLSGGQRQRLGIARALYLNPDVIVFDEATSALDGVTETAVMDAVRSLSGTRTIILIAHRLRTVQTCDRILMLEAGRIVADGSYEELLSNSLPFRRLAGQAGNT
ncbi:MAG: ABC transporter ATP-binding protein [Hyphomicrobiales bacterium]